MQVIQITDNFSINLYTPKELKQHLDQYVIGQESAKKTLSVAVYNHFKRLFLSNATQVDIKVDKSNIILGGPTGCGKTFIIKTIADYMGVPYYIADATSLTQAGYVGDDVESILSGLLRMTNGDVAKAQCGIVFLDEVDKLSKKGTGTSITRDVGGEGVQQSLLKLVEGSTVGVPPQEGRKHPEQPLIYIDTTNILFVASGAFSGIEEIIKRRVQPDSKIGFTSDTTKIDFEKEEIFDYFSHEDLREFGMIPEFIGRFPVLANVNKLEKSDLVKIITEPKNNILDQYAALFAVDDIALSIEKSAIEYIAQLALTLKTGARGLRSIFESVMRDYMFELPGSGVTEIHISEEDVKSKLSVRYKNIKID